jgi:hypothetical protein
LNKAISAVNSLNVLRDFRKYGLKLDTHKQSESGDTSLLLLESWLSETIQNNLLSEIIKDVFKCENL